MKAPLLLFSFLLFSAISFGQPLMIASCYHFYFERYSPYKDSTAYYFDNEGKIRSAIQYYRYDNEEVWKPSGMSIYTANDAERMDAIYYHFNEQGKWEKSSRSIYGNTSDNHSSFDEYYFWNKDKGRFDLDSRKDQQLIYNGNKKPSEFHTVACENCSSNEPKETNTTVKYFYDQHSLRLQEPRR